MNLSPLAHDRRGQVVRLLSPGSRAGRFDHPFRAVPGLVHFRGADCTRRTR